MNIYVLTLFPGMFRPVISESIIGRAQKSDKVRINIYNIRDYAVNRHRKVDDKPFGGGPGMVLQCEPVVGAINAVKKISPNADVILMGPKGRLLDQGLCRNMVRHNDIIIICGHYEGMDSRIRDYVSQEISIGDYILTGGEIPAMVLIDSLVRLIPGVLGDKLSSLDESFSSNLLEYPHYTRPSNYKGKKVPDVLLSGDHAAIKKWRKKESIFTTIRQRPDLIRHISQLEL
jgi:tRNA (guanine37-N1)-methyltransferase